MVRTFKNKQGHTIKFYDKAEEMLPTDLPPMFTEVFGLPKILYQGSVLNYSKKWLKDLVYKQSVSQPFVQITK